MRWSLKIGIIAGTAIRVHMTFVVLLVWIWLAHYQISGARAAWEGLAFVVAVFGCVLLHEFGHIAVARRFGIKTPQIMLLPIGGVATLERLPKEPRQEMLIAIAGPLVNLAITALIVAALGGTGSLDQAFEPQDPRIGFLVRLAGVNIFLMLFNLIPAFPMDGGRVLRAVLCFWLPWVRATQIAAAIGQGIAFALGLFGLLYNPWLIVIAIFVYLAATSEEREAQIEDVAAHVRVSDVMITEFETLSRSASIEEAVDRMLATTQGDFPVVGSDGRLMGLLTRNSIITALKEQGPGTPVTQAMRSNIPEIDYRSPLKEGLRRMREEDAPVVAVVDDAGSLSGLINYETIGEILMVRSAASDDFKFGHLRHGGLKYRF
ncbi:site-2 protease family protein (plasmid) [Rhizobium sp. CB3090]|uniref:site-2 protease family protein n=1 Tax=Rhizobium sp. CB3090 TaxID=3039156 RepID=UPI0024B07B31|nr:site-2 protease family protein [Rhizobium sp. CB3090]WFU13257.1 site-2 protease family protein [Rhizobium sp. CB3090]